jgi:hypothetical protein
MPRKTDQTIPSCMAVVPMSFAPSSVYSDQTIQRAWSSLGSLNESGRSPQTWGMGFFGYCAYLYDR